MKQANRNWLVRISWGFGIIFLVGNVLLLPQTAKDGKHCLNETRRIAVKGMTFEFVCIPAGEFVMGSESSEGSEKPAHRVQVKSFEMGKTEVTVRQFRTFVEATGYQTNAEKGDERGNGIFVRRWSPNPGDRDWGFKEDGNWRNPGIVQSDEDPVGE